MSINASNELFHRLCFATSREGQFSDILSFIHLGRYTPVPALVFHVSAINNMILLYNGHLQVLNNGCKLMYLSIVFALRKAY